MDKIILRGLRVYAYHGVFPEEKREGQTFVLDITLSVDLTRAGETDALADTVSYADVVETVKQTMTEKACDLIEHAASRVAAAILAAYPPVTEVTVRLAKPEAPVDAEFEYMAVEITRSR
ncbi:MAG: dihydroneopterin aldolase [Clostridia bacterium]|nr:dihydroneopterin aldolase [Clostridia bacterium]